jgi:alkylated DNA repair dioxygenase AlkB
MYGHVFSYRSRRITTALGPLPDTITPILNRLMALIDGIDGVQTPPFDMLLINEYLRGQGIMPHKDANVFGPVGTFLD